MTKWGLLGVVVAALAAYGCSSSDGIPIGDGGVGGADGGLGGMGGGGAGGAAGMGGAGAGGVAGMGGTAGMGGIGGMPAVATSCLDLLNDGVNIDGTYAIEIGGQPFTVYCDMTTDGGGWTQVYDQEAAQGFLPTAEWAAGVNVGAPNQGQYSILSLIDAFEGVSPGFEFYIDWPSDGTGFVRWEQSGNPLLGRANIGAVSNIVESPTNQVGCTPFSGLAADGDGDATLDGSANDCWSWAIGTSAPYGGGIPAYGSSDAGSLISAMRTRLWVR